MELSLRTLRVADIDNDFVLWHQNNDGHLDYYTGSRRSFSEEELNEWISTAELSNTYFYLIIAGDKHPIGTVKIGPIDQKNKTSDLACLIGKREYLGKGLASRIIAMANETAFVEHDIRRLQSGMFEENIPSIKAYCRAGWQIEGRMRGYYWVDEKPMDRICVACFNPKYFPNEIKNEDK